MNKVIVNEPIGRAALSQLALASASRAAIIINKPRRVRTIGAVFLSPTRQIVLAGRRKSAPIDRWLPPRQCSANITPRSSLLRCLLRLSIATSYALRALGVALET